MLRHALTAGGAGVRRRVDVPLTVRQPLGVPQSTDPRWMCCLIGLAAVVAVTGCLDQVGTVADVPRELDATEPDLFEDSAEVDDATIEVDDAPVGVEPDVAEEVGDAEVEVGPQPRCPVAVIDAPDRAVAPGATVQLYGDHSYSPQGGQLEYAWQVEAPSGNATGFVPHASVANPTFVTDVAGTYRFRLSVTDQRGLPGCVAAEREVVAHPEPALRIELAWMAPSDVDPSDGNGPDLDLHFLHPFANGEYFDDPFDTFWANNNPDWGSLGSQVDNPNLSDSTDGSAPEILTLIAPEQGTRYCVGVNYWTDHDLGPAHATVRIFFYGVLAFAVADVELVKHDLWRVTCFTWPSEQIALSTIDGELDITPDYQHPRWFQP